MFETLTNNRCIVDTFDRNFQYDVAHVSLANAADLMLIAPEMCIRDSLYSVAGGGTSCRKNAGQYVLVL